MTVTTELYDDSRIRVITLSDPAKLNAIGDDLRNGLADELVSATSDARCRAVVVTGANGAFSAGGELSGMPTDPAAIARRMGRLHDVVRMVALSSHVVVSAVDGVAYGSGLSLAAAADIAIAGDQSKFGCTFGRVGLVPDVGFMWSVPRRIGLRRARLLALQTSVIGAEQALDWGLVDEICPAGKALDAALDKASRVIRTPAVTVAHLKAMFATNYAALDDVLSDELHRQTELLGTEEFAAARQAFLSRNG